MTAWYARGEVGEAVRDVMDAFLDDVIDSTTAIRTLTEMGLNEQELLTLIEQELEIQRATFH